MKIDKSKIIGSETIHFEMSLNEIAPICVFLLNNRHLMDDIQDKICGEFYEKTQRLMKLELAEPMSRLEVI